LKKLYGGIAVTKREAVRIMQGRKVSPRRTCMEIGLNRSAFDISTKTATEGQSFRRSS
jgi:hypothetical protein